MNFDGVKRKGEQCFQNIEHGMGKLKEIDVEVALNMVNEGILVMYASFLTKGFLGTTMFRIHWPEHFHDAILVITITLLVWKLLLIRPCGLSELITMGVFVGVFLMSRAVSGYTLLGELLLFMLALRGIPFDRIIRIHFVTIVFLLVVTIVCSQIGLVDNLVYYRGEKSRQSFGVCYPTDFAAYFAWLGLAWAYIRKERLRFVEIGLMLLAGAGVWHFCDARLSAGVLFLTVAILAVVKLRQTYLEHRAMESNGKKGRRKGNEKVLPDWMQNIMVLAIPLCAAVIVLLSYCYPGDGELLHVLDFLLSERLSLGRLAFDRFDVELFGQFVPMVGFGRNTVTQLTIPEYFFLDSSFMSILMCYGGVLFLLIIAAFANSALRAKKRNDYYLVLILMVVAVDCMVEHHMMEIWYNPFLTLLLSDAVTWKEKEAGMGMASDEVIC